MITSQDVAQLNNSFNNLGNDFMQVRMEKDRQKQLGEDNKFRQEGLDIAKDRNRIAEQDDKTRAGIAQTKAAVEDYLKQLERAQKLVDRGDANGNPLPQKEIDELQENLKLHPGWRAIDATTRLRPKQNEKPVALSEYSRLVDPVTGKVIVAGAQRPDHSDNLTKGFTLSEYSRLGSELTKAEEAERGALKSAMGSPEDETLQQQASAATKHRKALQQQRASLVPTVGSPPSFSLGSTNAPPQAPTAPPASPAAQTYPKAPPGAQEGSKVRNKQTGQTGTVKGGFIIPD